MEPNAWGCSGEALSRIPQWNAFQAAEQAMQLLVFVPASFSPPLLVMPSDSMKMSSIGRRSRTENPMTIMSGHLHQHQRVHDADETFFVDDPVDRFADFFDPDQGVVYQTGLYERAQEMRSKLSKQEMPKIGQKSGQCTTISPPSDRF